VEPIPRDIEKLPKTNNYIEGWHKKLSSLVDCHHPNIWKLLDKIKESQSLTEMTQTQLTAGRLPRIGQKTYRDIAERIIRIIDDLGNKPIWFYLDGKQLNQKQNESINTLQVSTISIIRQFEKALRIFKIFPFQPTCIFRSS